MGDVIGLGKKRPNGAKIAALRKQGGLKQTHLAEKAGLSERSLRDVERDNHAVHATTLTNIATALGTTPDEITLSTDGTPDSSVSLLKLTAIRSAKDLSALASAANAYDWMLEVDPSSFTAKEMQRLMMMVRRLIFRHVKDEFDAEPFGEIPRLAQLQGLLDWLRNQGVGVIAGKYGQYSLVKIAEDEWFFSELTRIPGKPNWAIKTTFVLCLHFVAAEKEEGDIQIRPGKSLERWLREIQHLADDEIARLYADQCPFNRGTPK